MRRRTVSVILSGLLAGALVVACVPPPPGGGPPAAAAVVAAGDIACSPGDRFYNGGLGDATHCQMRATADRARLLDPDAVLLTGDLQYSAGTLAEFRAVFDKTWGRFKAITHPAPGNHEYLTPGAAGYLDYFGAAAAPAGSTWYSFDLGAWHVVALDSNCNKIGGCGPSSAQGRWLAADLASNSAACTLAFWHHPAFSSAPDGGARGSLSLWEAVANGGVDLVLNGHRHHYERFAPLDAAGAPDSAFGVREIVVGTGGNDIETFGTIEPTSEARLQAFGVARLDLAANGYSFRFVDIGGVTRDQGSGTCHGKPA